MELFGVPWPEDMECSRCENHRFFMNHCFSCSIFKIICLLVHQFLRTFQSVYITYNFEQKFHASELFISLGIWNEMKKVEKEKHFYEEILKTIKKNIIKILIVDIFPLLFIFFRLTLLSTKCLNYSHMQMTSRSLCQFFLLYLLQ